MPVHTMKQETSNPELCGYKYIKTFNNFATSIEECFSFAGLEQNHSLSGEMVMKVMHSLLSDLNIVFVPKQKLSSFWRQYVKIGICILN